MLKRGFTIVELLIVIVVIAILAAITIATFSEVQLRAKNTARISSARAWQGIITQYYEANNSQFPATSVRTCLGYGYLRDLDANLTDEDCGRYYLLSHPNDTWMNAFRTIANPLPAYPNDKMVNANDSAVWNSGIVFSTTDTYDIANENRANYPYLTYWLYGNAKDCVLRPVLRNAAGGGLVAVPGATNSYTSAATQITECRIGIFDISRLQ